MTLDLAAIRARFPSLGIEVGGRPVAYFDGPGGTQVPQDVIDATIAYYTEANANHEGAFITSQRSDARVDAAHAAVADLYGADADEVKFGQNMTSLTLHVSRSIGATMGAGDEIVTTSLDHEANIGPWKLIAQDRDLVIRTVDIHEDGTLDLDDLDAKLSSRTKLVCVGYASNALGTINPVAEIVRRAHAAGAWTYIDAVAYAPHGRIDVRALDTDFLVSSAYKWYGPHLGALYGKRAVLEAVPSYKIRPATDRFETGTQSFEGIVGAAAAVEYMAALADDPDGPADVDRRTRLGRSLDAIRAHELDLHDRLMRGLQAIPGVRIWGISDPTRFEAEKAPTISITLDACSPREASEILGRQGIFTWDGDFYAQSLIERLGQAETGGILRLGIVHYNTADEIDRVLEAIEAIAVGSPVATAG